MEYDIEVNVGVQVYGRLTKKGVEVAKEKGEPVAVAQDAPEENAMFSLNIATDPKTLQPQFVTLYSPVSGAPLTVSCVEFELLMRMYERGRAKLAQAVAKTTKAKPISLPEGTGAAPQAAPQAEAQA